MNPSSPSLSFLGSFPQAVIPAAALNPCTLIWVPNGASQGSLGVYQYSDGSATWIPLGGGLYGNDPATGPYLQGNFYAPLTIGSDLQNLDASVLTPMAVTNGVIPTIDGSANITFPISAAFHTGWVKSVAAMAALPTLTWGLGAGATAPTDVQIIGSGKRFRVEWTTTATPAASSAVIFTAQHARAFDAPPIPMMSWTYCSTAAIARTMALLQAAAATALTIIDASTLNSAAGFALVGGSSALTTNTKYSMTIDLDGAPSSP